MVEFESRSDPVSGSKNHPCCTKQFLKVYKQQAKNTKLGRGTGHNTDYMSKNKIHPILHIGKLKIKQLAETHIFSK